MVRPPRLEPASTERSEVRRELEESAGAA